MKGAIIFAVFIVLLQGKSMRVFINNAVVDAMDYLEMDLITDATANKHGQTSD